MKSNEKFRALGGHSGVLGAYSLRKGAVPPTRVEEPFRGHKKSSSNQQKPQVVLGTHLRSQTQSNFEPSGGFLVSKRPVFASPGRQNRPDEVSKALVRGGSPRAIQLSLSRVFSSLGRPFNVLKDRTKRNVSRANIPPASPLAIPRPSLLSPLASKPPFPRPQHRKNALSAQPTSLVSFVKKLELPRNKKVTLTPEHSHRTLVPPPRLPSPDQAPKEISLQTYRKDTDPNKLNQSKSHSSKDPSAIIDPSPSEDFAYKEPSASKPTSPRDPATSKEALSSIFGLVNPDDRLRMCLISRIRDHWHETGEILPTSLDFYRVSDLLGEGSYGKVYLANSVLCGLPVAIKCYERAKIKTESSLQRIGQEISILRELNHPNVIRFVEIFENSRFIFLALEFADRDDLLKHLRSHGRFSERRFLPVLCQLFAGLNYLHTSGVLHRDIKLDNVLLTFEGRVKICDFGVSKKLACLETIREHIGTPAYLSPEIVAGKGYRGFASDIWALGVLTYIALFGLPPFKGESLEQLNQNILLCDLEIPKSPEVSSQMRKALLGMLDKNPQRRLSILQASKLLNIKLDFSKKQTFAPKILKNQSEIFKIFGFSEKEIQNALAKSPVNHLTALDAIWEIHRAP